MEQTSLVIAVDAMGGDHAPESVIAGVKSAEEQHPDIRFLIFGDDAKVLPFVEKYRLDATRYDQPEPSCHVSSLTLSLI